MKSGQKGFTVIETLLVLILLAILGFTGYYVWHSQKTANSTYNSAAKTSNSTASSSADNWQTYTGKVTDQADNSASEADQISYTFKYPGDWKFFPIGTQETVDGQTGANSFQEIAPSLGSNKAISFNGRTTSKNAEDYYHSLVGDQSGLIGPKWEGVGSVSTKSGYSGYTSKLVTSTGTTYETDISNNKSGVVVFNYGAAMNVDQTTMRKIFESVNIP